MGELAAKKNRRSVREVVRLIKRRGARKLLKWNARQHWMIRGGRIWCDIGGRGCAAVAVMVLVMSAQDFGIKTVPASVGVIDICHIERVTGSANAHDWFTGFDMLPNEVHHLYG